MKVPIPPSDGLKAPGEQYRDWLAEARESNPSVLPDDVVVAVSAGEPGPDGVVRNYPMYADAFDILLVCLAEEKD